MDDATGPFEHPCVAAGIAGLAQRFRRGEETASSALRIYQSRVARHDPVIGAFLDLDPDGAAASAAASDERWRRGTPMSRLDGVPIGIKANIAVRGLPWTAGIDALRGRVADADAFCVARLRRAGAVIVGTLNMDEGALGARTDNPWFGRTRNPHALDRTPGGSSGGPAAAVAAGLVAGAIGTDTMGSVRLPAACCGVVGHDPERGHIECGGITPLAMSYDNPGVLARSVVDARLLLDAAAAQPGKTEANASVGHPSSVAVLTFEEAFEVDGAQAAAFSEAIEAARAAGWQVQPLRLVGIDLPALVKQLLLVVEREGHAAHDALLRATPDGLSPAFRAMLEWGARQPETRVASAVAALADARDAIRDQLKPFAALLTPAMPVAAERFDQATPWNRALFTVLGSVAGLPATVLPIAAMLDGLPAGLQIIAKSDHAAFGIAERLAPALRGVPAPSAFRA